MTWLHRRRERKRLLREAETLEKDARRLRRSLADDISRTFGVPAGIIVMGLAAAAELDPRTKVYAQLLMEPHGPDERAKEFEAAAREKREEAGRL